MRLGQLARKLELRPNEIIEFLASKEIVIDNSSNTRLDDEHVVLIAKHFAPGKDFVLQEDVKEIGTIDTEVPPSVVKVEQVAVIRDEIMPAPAEDMATEVQEVSSEIIKAQKIELSGLKVVGKIDLPEPKKKADSALQLEETEKREEQNPQERSQKISDRRSYRKEKPEEFRPRKNPIAAQREREALDLDKKKRAMAAQAKEKRTENYLKKVKPAAPTKAAKIISEPLEALSDDSRPKPATLFGRLLKWLKQP